MICDCRSAGPPSGRVGIVAPNSLSFRLRCRPLSRTIQTIRLNKKPKISAERAGVAGASNSDAIKAGLIQSDWRPLAPPKRREGAIAFHAYMLVPGLSVAFHAETLGRSRSMISLYRRRASEAAKQEPALSLLTREIVGTLTPADGMRMAQMRGSAHLPYWSRLAICEWCKRGIAREVIAEHFRCSLSTVGNVLAGRGSGYEPLSGERVLTKPQRRPPGQYRPSG